MVADALSRRLAVIEITTPHLSFADDLELYARAGVAGIGILESKLGDVDEAVEAFRHSGLVASSVILTTGSILPSSGIPGPNDPAARVESICAAMERLLVFEPACFTIAPGPLGDHTLEAARSVVGAGLRRIAARADELGTRIALESMHPSLGSLFSFAVDLTEASLLLELCGSETVGLCVDLWHVGEEPDVLARLEELAGRVVTVHVDDRRLPTRSWVDRVLPGDGVDDVAGMLAALARGGYAGWLELEILSDDGSYGDDFDDSLWKLDPFELVCTARDRVASLGLVRD